MPKSYHLTQPVCVSPDCPRVHSVTARRGESPVSTKEHLVPGPFFWPHWPKYKHFRELWSGIVFWNIILKQDRSEPTSFPQRVLTT